MDWPHRLRRQVIRQAQAEPRLQDRLVRQAYQRLLPIVQITLLPRAEEPIRGRRKAAGDSS